MKSISPRRSVTFHPESMEFHGVEVQVKPLTQPQRAKLMGEVQLAEAGKLNLGEVAAKWAMRQVTGWSGLDVEFSPGPNRLDDFPAELMMEVLSFLIVGSRVDEEDAGN